MPHETVRNGGGCMCVTVCVGAEKAPIGSGDHGVVVDGLCKAQSALLECVSTLHRGGMILKSCICGRLGQKTKRML